MSTRFECVALLGVSLCACARPPSSSTQSVLARSTTATSVSSADSGVTEAVRPAEPVVIEAPSQRERARAALLSPTRWQLANGVRVEHRAFALANTVHVRLVVAGVGSESSAGRSLRESLRLALALEEGGTRRNLAPTFAASLAQVGAELRVDAARRGMVFSLDASASDAPFVLRKLGELVSEPSVARETPSFASWIARRTHPSLPTSDTTKASLRRAALAILRGNDLPWSPREWIDAAPSFAWPQDEDSTSRGLAREALRGGAMTLIVAGAITAEALRTSLVAERWAAVARGNGIAVAPLAPLHNEGSMHAAYRAGERASAAVAWRLPVSERAADNAATLLLETSIDSCSNRSWSSSFFDDPARPVLVLSTNGAGSTVDARTVASMIEEPARVLGDECFARSFEASKTAVIDARNPRDPARWADVRAWAAHDGATDESAQATLDALVSITVEQARASARSTLATAPRALVFAAPAGSETALCSVSGVRSVRVGNESRACP